MIRILGKQRVGLKICHLNAQSLPPKIDEFRYLFESSGIDVVCVSETWLSSWHSSTLFYVDGYVLYRSDRIGHGGGVAMFVKSSLSSKIKCISDHTNSIEYVFVEIMSNYNKILVGCVYRPNKQTAYERFIDFTENLCLGYNNILIAGDFNSDLLTERKFSFAMRSLGLFPVNISTPTHITQSSSTLLDIFYVNDTSKILIFDQLSVPNFSKHDLIFTTFDFKVTCNTASYSYRDFMHINYDQLGEAVDAIPWKSVYSLVSTNEQIAFLQTNINALFDQHVPFVIKSNNGRNHP